MPRELEDAAESCEREHALWIVEPGAHQACRGRERAEKQHREDADDHAVEDVGERRAPHREAAADHHQHGRRRRPDALADQHRTALLEGQRAGVERDQGRRRGGSSSA
jgi:hypothetical protein